MNPDFSAEEIMGAALDLGIHSDLLEELMDEFEATGWVRIGEKGYPPCYAYALGRYPAHPAAVARMRRELASVPRVNPAEYDILFNVEGGDPLLNGPTWDVVKWLRVPELQGCLPGHGWLTSMMLDPYPVYSIPASRPSWAFSDVDFTEMKRNATTLRDGGKGISMELLENNLKKQAERRQEKADADLDFAEYHRRMFKDFAEELGI